MIYIVWVMTLAYSFSGTSCLSIHGLSSSRSVYNSEKGPTYIFLWSNSIRNIISHMLGSVVEFYLGIIAIIYKCFFQFYTSQVMRLKNAFTTLNINKGKAVPLQPWSSPEGSRKLRFSDFMTTAQGGGKVVSHTHWPHLPPRNSPGTHFW